MFSSDYGMDTKVFNSLSTSNDVSTTRKKKKKGLKSKKSKDSKTSKKQLNKRNSFIAKIAKKKEAESSQETAATIGNMKKHAVDHNYFGLLFGKNPHATHSFTDKTAKRIKEMSTIMNSHHLLSPGKGLGLMRSMEHYTKGKYISFYISHVC